MHQQNPIVIDFQEIFKEDQPKPQPSLLSTSLDHSLSQTITLHRNQRFPIAEETSDVSQKIARTRKSMSKSHLNTVSAPQQLQNLRKLIEQKQGQSSANKTCHVDIAQLTNRLHSSTLCKKQECSRHRSIKQIKDFEDSLPLNKQPKNSQSKSTASLLPKYYAFERLHNLSKLQQLRKTYQLTDTTEKTNKSPKKEKSLSKSAHLKKYVPFYSRLQDEVNRSQQRIKIMQNNPQFASGNVEKFFKPRLIPNKYSQVSARYNECNKNRQTQNYMNSSFNSSFSSLDTSLDIRSRIQQHFYQKMKYIFANNSGDQQVKIDENAVKLLTEVQFSILQGFLVELESSAAKGSQFTDKLRNYYNNLPTDQKRALRTHEIRDTNKYREIRKKLSKDKKEADQKPTVSTVNKKCKKPEGNYHSKIKAYI